MATKKAKAAAGSAELRRALDALLPAKRSKPTDARLTDEEIALFTAHGGQASSIDALLADPKKRGRPATGRTPDAERQRKSRQARAEAGGKTISIVLGPDAAEALGIIMLLENLGEKEAIEHALSRTASLAQRREKARKG